jgi:hypothetical protein
MLTRSSPTVPSCTPRRKSEGKPMTSVTATKTIHRAGATAGDSRVTGETLPTYTANAPSGAVNWSDNGAGGSFSPASGNSTTYTPPNQSRNSENGNSITITATDSANFVNASLDVYSSFPLSFDYGYDADLVEKSKISYSEDDTPVVREQGTVKRQWSVGCLGRSRADTVLAEAHFSFHRIARKFYLVDDELNVIKLVRYDTSKLGVKVVTANSNDITALFREA